MNADVTGRYIQLLVQEMSLKLEVGFLLSVLAVFKFKEAADAKDFEVTLRKFLKDIDSTKLSLTTEAKQSRLKLQEHIYDYLHLSPIKVLITAFWSYCVHFNYNFN